jgi:Ca-activated chloride channel family protein
VWALLLVPVLLLIYVLAQRGRRAYAMRFTNLELLSTVAPKSPGVLRHIPALLFIGGLALLLVAAARPNAVVAVPRDQADVILVIDTSGSMAATDLAPDRMTAAKEAAKTFVRGLTPGTRVGVVNFNGTSYLDSELTNNHEHVLRVIDRLQAFGGTALGDGLYMALDQFSRRIPAVGSDLPPAAIVVLADGASTSGRPPLPQAEDAARRGIPVYTVGVGQRGARVLVNGNPVQLEETTLQQVAQATNAEYFYVSENATLDAVYRGLASRLTFIEERTEVTAYIAIAASVVLVLGALASLRWFARLP